MKSQEEKWPTQEHPTHKSVIKGETGIEGKGRERTKERKREGRLPCQCFDYMHCTVSFSMLIKNIFSDRDVERLKNKRGKNRQKERWWWWGVRKIIGV